MEKLEYRNMTLETSPNENDDRFNDVFVEYRVARKDSFSRRFNRYDEYTGSYARAIGEGTLDGDAGEIDIPAGLYKWLESKRVAKWLNEVNYG